MKILIVDDKPENLYLLELILKGNGYNTISAKNGAEALALTQKEIPDLVITDILMPVMDGFTLCRELKKDDKLCAIPLIFYTATYTDPKDEEFALSLGAERFLVKPKEPEEFIVIVEEVLKEARDKNINTSNITLLPDQLVLKEYNEALIRKLEDKMMQAEEAEKRVRKYNIALLREIEERKQVEELLRKSERQITLIYDTVGDVIFNLKVVGEGQYIFASVNQCFLTTTGLQSSQIIGKSVHEIIPEPSLSLVLEKYAEAIRERRIVRWEETSHYPSGELIGAVSIAPVFDANSNCISLVGSVHDITERKIAEKELLESNERYKNLANISPVGIFHTDSKGGTTYVNPKWCEISRLSVSESLDFGWINAVHPGDRDMVLDGWMESTKNQKASFHDYRFLHKDGTVAWVMGQAIPERNSENKIVGYIGTITDITERKLAEEALQKSEGHYRMLFDQMTNGFAVHEIILDDNKQPVDYRFLQVNSAFEQLTGFRSEDIIGKTVLEVMPKTELMFIQRYGEVALSGKSIQFESFSGELNKYYSIRAYAPEHGKFATIFEDITERKRSEAEIRMLAHSLRSVNECVSITDMEDKIIFVNQSFCKTYGFNENELIGQHMSIVRSSNNPPEVVAEILPATLRGGWSGEILNRRKDSSEFPIFLSTTIINDKEGKSLGLIGVAKDITERKIAERELIEAKERAERSDKLKTEFLAQMSHEVRTPISVINGNVGYLSELFGETMDEDVKGCFDGIALASQRIIRTMELILNYSELQTSGYKPEFSEIDLDRDVLSQLIFEYKRPAEKKGLSIQFTNKLGALKIKADEYSIKQIFANLIDNAVKYTKKGQVEILLDKNEAGNIFAQVKDTGVGMSSEFLSKLYEPFVQEEHGYSRSFDGNGLGLALVQKYCMVNNVVIKVDSEKNVGSSFKVIFSE